jgi:hypothetical protein
MKPHLIPVSLALGGYLLAGCITHEETVYRDAPRTKVHFENDTAASVFYEALSRGGKDGKTESTTEVSIPVVFSHKQKVVEGASQKFNQAVAACDTNNDGAITEREARVYAKRAGKK